MERQGRRCKLLLDDLKETRGYWKFKEKHCIVLCVKPALEEDMDLLYDTLETCMNTHALHSLSMVNPIRLYYPLI
jgi:hypothetical protein